MPPAALCLCPGRPLFALDSAAIGSANYSNWTLSNDCGGIGLQGEGREMNRSIYHPAIVAAAVSVLLGVGSAAGATTVTVCNESPATAHVAFANEIKGSYTTTGWWTIPLDSCQDVDFTLQGDTLYFTADSDVYKDSGRTVTNHWGTSQLSLFVSSNHSGKFNYTNAQKSRGGAKSEQFQPDSVGDHPEKLAKITVHIKKVGSSVDFVSNP